MTRDRLARLRDRLDTAGYPSGVLGRLFADGLRVGEDAVRDALSAEVLADCVALELAAVESGTVVARQRIADHDGLLLVLDPPETKGDWLHVMAPSGSTRTVSLSMRREPCGDALDLGCGCGLLALHAAGHAGRVVATDANPRAARLTELSAGLNRLTNVETRVGKWFEPVADEQFDQTVCNPPFVVSPESTRLYRDSGFESDGVCRMIVDTVPRHLKLGGVAHVLVNWVVRADGCDPIDEWTAGSGCEVFLQRLPTYDPPGYARHWLGDRADSPAFDEWMAYYRTLAATAIGAGVLTLTRRVM